MTWKIDYYNEDLQTKILRFPKSILARYVRLTDRMKEYGADLGMPHTKPLGTGLFELRLKGEEGIARIFYCTKVGKQIFMLHCFIKKTDKIPKRELDIARKRMEEVKKHG